MRWKEDCEIDPHESKKHGAHDEPCWFTLKLMDEHYFGLVREDVCGSVRMFRRTTHSPFILAKNEKSLFFPGRASHLIDLFCSKR
jgi:hypothetical protein